VKKGLKSGEPTPGRNFKLGFTGELNRNLKRGWKNEKDWGRKKFLKKMGACFQDGQGFG